MSHRSRRIPLVFLLAGLTCGVSLRPVSADDAQDDARVSQFLDRLGLTDIEILHLERMLAEPQAPPRRTQLGKKLADLYAAQLMSAEGDSQQARETLERIDALIRKTPEVNTPSLQVMLLQADYHRAETLVTRWIADATEVQARDEAKNTLAAITPKLNDYQTRLNGQVEAEIDALNGMPDGEAYEARQKQMFRLQAVAGRATYFSGWSNYYLGLLQNPPSQPDFDAARSAFRKLLEMGETAYSELDAEWLGLESEWRARAIIGLGLTEAARGDLEASKDCFQLLRHASVSPEIQDQGPYWYVQGLLNAGRTREATEFAADEVDAYNGKVSRGKFSLCVSLVRAGFGPDPNGSATDRREMGLLGLRGLAKLGQQKAVRQLIEQYKIELEDGGGFQLRWIEGRRLLTIAEETKSPEDFRAAATALQDALLAPDADQQVAAAAQCRYELAWCLYQTGRYEEAAREYRQAVTGLKGSDDESAARAAWMAFAAYQKLVPAQPRFRAAAIDTLRDLKRDFPDHSYAQRADYYISKLSQPETSTEATVASLEKIPADAPAYLSARYDICLLLYEVWRQADSVDKAAASKRLADAVEQYLRNAGNREDASRQLKCCLLAADAALTGPPVDLNSARQLLDRAATLIPQVPEKSSTLAEYHYRGLQWAGKSKDDQQRREHAQWLVEHAAGSAYEVPALIVAASAIDQALEAAAESQKPTLRDEAIGIYGRLVTRLGDSPEAIAEKKNVRVAISKLAGYQFDADRFAAAAESLEKLLAVFPASKAYLRRAALAHFQSGDLERSLPRWRSLLAGVARNSNDWYEAKYYQILCLLGTDPDSGRRVLEQFQLLHPDLGPDTWRVKFQQLIDRS